MSAAKRVVGPGHRLLSPGELFAAAGFAIVGGCGMLLWATLSLAGLLFGSGAPSPTPFEIATTAAGLVQHVDAPRDALPEQLRTGMPASPIAYLAAFLVVLLLVGVLVALVVAGARRLLRARPTWGRGFRLPGGRHGASWGASRDVRQLRVRRSTPGRMTLGVDRDGQLIAGEKRSSTIIFAPTQTGKTAGLAVPVIVEHHGPALVASNSTDVLRLTLSARTRQDGEVRIFDPFGVTGEISHGWSPLSGCDHWTAANRMGKRLARHARPPEGGMKDADFWFANAAKLIGPHSSRPPTPAAT